MILERSAFLTTAKIASCAFFEAARRSPGLAHSKPVGDAGDLSRDPKLVISGKMMNTGKARRMLGRRVHKIYALAGWANDDRRPPN